MPGLDDRSVRGAFGDRQRLHHVTLIDALGDLDPVDDIAEQVVERLELAAAVVDADEELAAVGVGSRIGHRDGAERVLTLHWLISELVARTASTGAFGIASLDDELGHDSVERETVVVAVTCE